jgi:hypothetical protein
MRYLILFLITISILTYGCDSKPANRAQEAVDYNKKLISLQRDLMQLNDDLIKQITDNEDVSAEKYRVYCAELCDSAHKTIKTMGPFYKDENYQLAAIKYFDALKKLYTDEWNEVMQLRNTIRNSEEYIDPNGLIYGRLQKLGAQIDTKLNKYINDIEVAQKVFAKRYKFTLSNDPSLLPYDQPKQMDSADEPMKEEAGE